MEDRNNGFKSMIDRHPVFKKVSFQNSNNENKQDGKRKNTSHSQIMEIQHGTLFLWEKDEPCLYTTNLKNSLDRTENLKYQKLMSLTPPLFEVKSIEFNSSGAYLLLYGDRGISVFVLPEKWGKSGEFEGGKDVVFCRSIPIAERFYMTCITVKLLKASWYPGSNNESHICTLTSDGIFRIYDLSEPQSPIQTHKLNQSKLGLNSSSVSVHSVFSIASAIGESIISFDFGSPHSITLKRPNILKARNPSTKDTFVTFYPVYLLQGDGEVMLLLTNIADPKYSHGFIYGPLTVLPPAEDNYGVDASSILVLKYTTPNIIVIATSSGRLHHCVAINSEEINNDVESLDTWRGSEFSTSSRIRQLDYEAPTLYVYETIEIDLDLPGETNDPFNNFLSLYPDPLLTFRYHICSVTGVFTAVLPWASTLANHIQENLDESFVLKENDECAVKHVICTKSTVTAKQLDVVGFSIAKDPLFGPSMLCYTEDGCCSVHSLLSVYQPPLPSLLVAKEDEKTLVEEFSLHEAGESNFYFHVQNLLRRNASQPVLRSSKQNQSVTQREAFQLIEQATHVLQEEYILKQKLAKDAIEKRVSLLQMQKSSQMGDLQELKGRHHNLEESAAKFAEDYEDCFDQQESLTKRVEIVLRHYTSKIAVLSKAEMDMSKEMQGIHSKLSDLQNKIKQVQLKFDYQKDKREKADLNDTKVEKSVFGTLRNVQHVEKFKETLFAEGQKISDLIKKLNNLKIQAGV